MNYEVDTHEAIVEAVAPSYLMRQKQTEDTPSMMSPLLDDLGYLAYPAADGIIDGRYRPPPGTDPYACECIEVLAIPSSIRAKDPVNCIATVEEHRAGWKAQKKRTASEQSTIGFEHYKTSIFDDELCSVDCLFRTIPLAVGFVTLIWMSVNDVAILKKLGMLEIDVMRIIQLMGADFQSNNKLVGKEALAAMSLTPLSLVGFAFVDDADLVDGAIDVDAPGEGIIDRFQSAMDR